MSNSLAQDTPATPLVFWRFEHNTSYAYVPVETISLHRGTTKVRLLQASQSHKEGTVLCVATSQLVNEIDKH